MQAIDINQAVQHLPELVEQTISGDDIVITKEGHPVVKLVAICVKPTHQRKFGTAKGLIKISDDFDATLNDFKEYM
ncbi:MAG: type II toxin-antitoxin system prevent-host-death family antitoxin [Smithellaceae bacterium]|jgi:prevent-host-death family protein|nr:type II toxin-antitoxin system prevent-host-death family antitoxin [Smithellaceae bacterium]